MTNRNANRPGYKHAKLGWIPEEWECEKIDSLALIQTGVAKSSKRNYVNPILLPYLRVANVQDGYLDLSEIKNIAIDNTEIERYLLKPGDVLFTEGGDFDKLGRGTIWMGEIKNCIHQNHIFAVRVRPQRLLPSYLALVAASAWGRKYFILSSKKSTNLASINSTQLRAFPIPLPPLHEQERIADVLSAWDRALTLMDRLIGAKQRLKQGLMLQLLTGRLRFPHFGSRRKPELIETKAGSIPQDWQCLPGKKVFKNSTEKGRQGLPLLSVTIDSGIVARDSLDRKMPNSIPPEQSLYVRRGDIAYNMMRAWQGAIALVPVDGIVSPAYVVLRTRGAADPLFMSYLFRSHLYRHLITSYSYGLTEDRLRLYYKDFGLLPIILPPLEEQKRIAATLDACDRELQLLTRKRTRLQEQKKGLMQKLLTGEVRVKSKGEVSCND